MAAWPRRAGDHCYSVRCASLLVAARWVARCPARDAARLAELVLRGFVQPHPAGPRPEPQVQRMALHVLVAGDAAFRVAPRPRHCVVAVATANSLRGVLLPICLTADTVVAFSVVVPD